MQPVVIGSAHVLQVHAAKLGFSDLVVHLVTQLPEQLPEGGIMVLDVTPGKQPPVEFGAVTEEGGQLAMLAVEQATDLCKAGHVDAMVTAPISKAAIALAGYDVPGHTEFIARRVGCTSYTMMMVADTLRVGLVTTHIPIWDVPKNVTHDAILEKVAIISQSLSADYGIQRPRIAVLGLNPHAGDGGVLGREEEESIAPAIQEAGRRDHLVFGPFAADGFFAVMAYRRYDAVLAMYHDQGLVPFKTLAFDTGVNYTAGLQIVRTSPDHGTAYDIAGKGTASPGSMRSAIYLAIDIARRRMDQAAKKKMAS
jgi:4-hydroxythreonine-4-phosphate dehydrogenase